MGLRCWPYPKSEIRKFNIIFNHFAQFLRQIRCQIGLQLIRGVPDPIKTIKKLDQRRWPRQNGCGHLQKMIGSCRKLWFYRLPGMIAS